MAESPNRLSSGHHKATCQGILGKEIWRKNVDSTIQVQVGEDGGGSTFSDK